MTKWVNICYRSDLKQLGFEPVERKSGFIAYNLTETDWKAFVSLMSETTGFPPKLYDLPCLESS